MIEVSNVNLTDTDVDSLMKSANLSFPIFTGINLKKMPDFHWHSKGKVLTFASFGFLFP